ncbi:hypothetical protein [Streptomyces sp. NPDC055140]
MANAPANTIQTKYAQQWADDLQANRTRQGELTQELEQLKTDEAWLLQHLKDVPTTATSATNAAVAEDAPAKDESGDSTATVPQPRQDAPAKAAAKKTAKAAAKKTAKAASKKAAAKKTTARKPAVKAAPKDPVGQAMPEKANEPAKPPLHELMLAMLLKMPGEPRTTKELHTQLAEEHPDRATTMQTVRNSLDRLIATSRGERTKQGNTVMYSAGIKTNAAPTEADATASGAGGNVEQASAAEVDDKAAVGA